MRRAIAIAATCVGLGVVFWFVPPFHIVSLKQAQAAKTQGVFNAAEFAARFWSERLTPAWSEAADALAVCDSLAKDPKAAARNYGRTIGVSDAVYYFVRGTGTVVSIEGKGIGVSLHGASAGPDLRLKTGMLFGNAVRDATELLNASEFPNSQNFNDLSTELNRIVETQVLPKLKATAAVGRKLHFVGCAEIEGDDSAERPLQVIPVLAEFQ